MDNPVKSSLRAEVRAQLRGLSAAQRSGASESACQVMRAQEVWHKSARLLGYMALPDELDLFALLAQALGEGKVVALPQFDPQTGCYRACQIRSLSGDLVDGKFGIREPAAHCADVPLNQLDLTLVPGVAFDGSGRRLGRGRGFYDRLLLGVPGVKCGVGFEEQLVSQVPMEPHDVLVDCLLTPSRWRDFRRRRHGEELVG